MKTANILKFMACALILLLFVGCRRESVDASDPKNFDLDINVYGNRDSARVTLVLDDWEQLGSKDSIKVVVEKDGASESYSFDEHRNMIWFGVYNFKYEANIDDIGSGALVAVIFNDEGKEYVSRATYPEIPAITPPAEGDVFQIAEPVNVEWSEEAGSYDLELRLFDEGVPGCVKSFYTNVNSADSSYEIAAGALELSSSPCLVKLSLNRSVKGTMDSRLGGDFSLRAKSSVQLVIEN